MQSLRKIFHTIYCAAAVIAVLGILNPAAAAAAEKKKFTVVIDAGHGGNDVGAHEHDVKEKDVNLAVALKLGELIKKKLKNTEVVYTRDKDVIVSLQGRADIANSAKGDLFVSIHCNSVDRSNKNRNNVLGATTYILGHHKDAANLAVAQRENSVIELDANDKARYTDFDPQSDESYIIYEMTAKKNFQNSARFAADVQKEMVGAGRYSRGVQQAGFWVLWSTAMPAALVELDFICNPDQAKFLNSNAGQEKLAGAIFNAVKNYENYYRKSLGLASEETDGGTYNTEETAYSTSGDGGSDTAAVAELVATTATDTALPHRAETRKGKAPSDPSSHRRRSSKARMEGASTVEQTEIALREEHTVTPAAEETVIAAAESPKVQKENKKNAGKAAKKEKAKKTEVAKPARRNRESSRKAVRHNVNVGYKVLLFESEDELKATDEVFKGLSPVASIRENNRYKYTYGESLDRAEMENLCDEISALFPDARVIKCYF
ncbi:MAG: N-acetylmuramoyl-L-alanine amidase [Muribaculaceae bacterium]|nr:N-acetylmuramoyl-L-alanine amidase [Muribaculaceae bacterium]